jgi:hypothetical protein
VGGRLMLVDMAGSENIEAAGQTGFEAKMQVCDVKICNFSNIQYISVAFLRNDACLITCNAATNILPIICILQCSN